MLYLIITIAVLATATLALRCRIRLRLSNEQKLLFVGLGRTGALFDLANETSSVKLFGISIKTVGRRKTRARSARSSADKRPPQRARHRLTLSVGDALEVGGRLIRALWKGQRSLLKGVKIEEFQGDVIGGFNSPDQSGIIYGCYQAVIGIVPQVAGRFHFTPYWQGAYLRGALNASVAIPLYRVVYELIATVLRLPIRKIISISIGKMKGVRNV